MKSLSEKNNKISASCISFLIVLWAAAVLFSTQTVVFETNDDSSMARMAYGMLGSYETHLVYINVFIGQCLKLCLTLFPGIPWYTVFQCGIAAISFWVIVYLFLSKHGIRKGLFPSFLLVLFFGSQFFIQLQFSKTAGIATLAGILLVFDAVSSDRGRACWKMLLGGLLTVIGSMYRFNLFLMILIPLFGIGLSLVYEPIRNRDWRGLLRICLPFIVIFAVCFLFRLYDSWSYSSSPDWAGYKEFNSLRSQLTDYGYPDYAENQQLYESLGIAQSDLNVYKRWDFADSEVITTETLRQLVAAKPAPQITPTECISAIVNFFLQYRYSAAMLIALAVSMTAMRKNRGFLLVYGFLAVLLIQLYMVFNGRYGHNRVDAPLACALFVVLLLYTWEMPQLPGRWMTAVMAVLLLLAPFSESFLSGETETADEKSTVFYELAASDQDHLYVRTTVNNMSPIPGPTEIYPVGYMSNSVALGGWATNTGTYRATIARYGVTNLYRDLVDNPQLYLVPSESYLKSRISYIRRNYASSAAAYPVKVTEDGQVIYRVCTSAHPVLDAAQAASVNGKSWAHYACKILVDEDATLSGYFYLDNTNSFAASIYYSLTGDDGQERLYYATQHYSDEYGDLMNGEYGSFDAVLPTYSGEDQLKLYLQTGDALYCIDLGAIGQYTDSAQHE